MTRILLVRHGQTQSNVTGYYMGWSEEDLTEDGVSAVHKLSSRLANIPVAAVYTSPLRRAYSTALILAKSYGVEPAVVNDLIEIKLGDWQGSHISEIRQRWHELWQQWRADPSATTLPGGESFSQVAERVLRAFRRIETEEQNKHVLIVTHEIVIKILVCYVLSAPYSIYRRFEIGNASLTIVNITENRMRLVTLNDTAHL